MTADGHKGTTLAIVEQIKKRYEVQHTREVREVRTELPQEAVDALVIMARRVERLERVIGALAEEVIKGD